MIKLGKKLMQFQIVILAAVLFMGVAGLSSTAAAASANAVGLVDFQLLMSQHPDMAAAKETMKAAMDQAQKDYDEKTPAMTTQEEKNAYNNKLQQQLMEKQQVLYGSIQDKIIAAIKEVANAKGMTAVVDKDGTIFGDQSIQDITAEVGKIITKK